MGAKYADILWETLKPAEHCAPCGPRRETGSAVYNIIRIGGVDGKNTIVVYNNL